MTTIGRRLRSMLYVCPALLALRAGSTGLALLASQPARAQDQDITGAELKKKLDAIEKAFGKPRPKPKPAPTPAPKTDSEPQSQSATGPTQTGTGQTGNGQTGNGQTGNGQTGNGQTGGSQTGNTQTGNTQTGNTQTGSGSGSTNPTPSSPGGPGFNDPNVTKVSYSPDGQTAYHHYKDGHIEGWRGGKIVVWIAPVAKAATPPAPVTPPAPPSKPKEDPPTKPKQASPGPKDRPVGAGMYEKAGTATLEKTTELHIAKSPAAAPQMINAETKLAAPVSKLTSFAKVATPTPALTKAPMVVTTRIGALTIPH